MTKHTLQLIRNRFYCHSVGNFLFAWVSSNEFIWTHPSSAPQKWWFQGTSVMCFHPTNISSLSCKNQSHNLWGKKVKAYIVIVCNKMTFYQHKFSYLFIIHLLRQKWFWRTNFLLGSYWHVLLRKLDSCNAFPQLNYEIFVVILCVLTS